jgi:hypothetical protein
MQKKISIFFISFFTIFFSLSTLAQVKTDSAVVSLKDTSKIISPDQQVTFAAKKDRIGPKDSTKIFSMDPKIGHASKQFSPRTATIRSAIIPGWGQLYNHKYWKIPLVYAALGTTAGIFFYNLKTYKQFRVAYRQSVQDSGLINDPAIEPDLRFYSQASLLANRNLFRQNIDYSVLFFVLFWGLNVVDATVDAHLKSFDVSDDISLELKPGYSDMANTNGISLVMNIGKRYPLQ